MVDRFVASRWPYVRSLLEAHRATAVNEVSPRGSIDSLIGDRRTSAGSAASRSILCLNFFSSGHSSSVIWPYIFFLSFSNNFFPQHWAACKSRDPAACPELVRGDRCPGKFTVEGYEKSPGGCRTCLHMRGWRVRRAAAWLESGARRSQVDPSPRDSTATRTTAVHDIHCVGSGRQIPRWRSRRETRWKVWSGSRHVKVYVCLLLGLCHRLMVG